MVTQLQVKYLLTHNAALLPQGRRLELLMVWPSLQFWEIPTTQKLEETLARVSLAFANQAAQFSG